MLPALLPSGAPVPVMSDSTQDRLNVSHSERDFSVANNLKLDLSSWADAGAFHLPLLGVRCSWGPKWQCGIEFLQP